MNDSERNQDMHIEKYFRSCIQDGSTVENDEKKRKHRESKQS